jgi:hypothetical protein
VESSGSLTPLEIIANTDKSNPDPYISFSATHFTRPIVLLARHLRDDRRNILVCDVLAFLKGAMSPISSSFQLLKHRAPHARLLIFFCFRGLSDGSSPQLLAWLSPRIVVVDILRNKSFVIVLT